MKDQLESIYDIEFIESAPEVAQSGYDFFRDDMTEVEKRSMDALVAIGEEDMVRFNKFIAELRHLLSKEGLKEALSNDQIRKNVFTSIYLLTLTGASFTGGALENSGSEVLRNISVFYSNLDQILNYIYELDQNARSIEMYSDDPNESDELRKARVKFFLSDNVYELVDKVKPSTIDNIVAMLGKINEAIKPVEASHES